MIIIQNRGQPATFRQRFEILHQFVIFSGLKWVPFWHEIIFRSLCWLVSFFHTSRSGQFFFDAAYQIKIPHESRITIRIRRKSTDFVSACPSYFSEWHTATCIVRSTFSVRLRNFVIFGDFQNNYSFRKKYQRIETFHKIFLFLKYMVFQPNWKTRYLTHPTLHATNHTTYAQPTRHNQHDKTTDKQVLARPSPQPSNTNPNKATFFSFGDSTITSAEPHTFFYDY